MNSLELTNITKNPLRILLVAILAFASVATVVAQNIGPAGPSPVTGHASVVATGSVEMTEDMARWHVTRHTAGDASAEEGGESFESTTQGFIIAENTPILVTIDAFGSTRLAGGEAMSIPGEFSFSVTTFGAPDTFLFVQMLGENEQQLNGGTDRILTSASFSVTPATLDASLLRDVLAEGEEGMIAAGNTPTVIYVTVGEVEVQSDRGTINVPQGEAATFEGELTITAIADGSTYYAGYVGAELPEVATPVPATPEPTEVPATPEPATPAPATPAPATPEATEVPATEEPAQIRTDVPDYLEIAEDPATLNPIAFEVDSDGDLVSDGVEIALGMNQDDPDTDGDGLSDYDEIYVYMTDPLNPDTDDDGLSDGEEVHQYGTDPNNPDTDGDLFYDGGEIIRGTDPLNPDTDGDGVLDGEEEYINETDPLDPDDN